jgi:hypothetical protein
MPQYILPFHGKLGTWEHVRVKFSSAAFMKASRNVTRQELEQYEYSHSRYTPQQEGNDYEYWFEPKLQYYKLEERNT